MAFPTTLTKDSVQVHLTESEAAELAAIRAPRDAAFRAYDEAWEALFAKAAVRQGIQRQLDAAGVPTITDESV